MPNGHQKPHIHKKSALEKSFKRLSVVVSKVVGSPTWFFFSIVIIITWALSGFFIGFDEIWHLHINSTTTILTFLMMSLLHATQSGWENKMEKIQKDIRHGLDEIKTELSEEIKGQKQNGGNKEDITSIH